MLEYGVTFVALIVLYVIASFINPISRSVIQQVALIKYKEHGETKYQLLRSDKKILKELIYTKNLNHIDIPVPKFEAIYFFNRDYRLKAFDGNHVRNAKDEAKEEILGMKMSFLNVYNKYSLSKFISFVRCDYENDTQ